MCVCIYMCIHTHFSASKVYVYVHTHTLQRLIHQNWDLLWKEGPYFHVHMSQYTYIFINIHIHMCVYISTHIHCSASYNKIENLDEKMGRLGALTSLNLSNNAIKELPVELRYYTCIYVFLMCFLNIFIFF